MHLLSVVGAIFLKGFKEVINVAVFLVAVYLLLSAVITSVALLHVVENPIFSSLEARRLFISRQPGGDDRGLFDSVSQTCLETFRL